MNSLYFVLYQLLIVSSLISLTITQAQFEAGKGGYLNSNVGVPVNDGTASGKSRKTYFKDSLY